MSNNEDTAREWATALHDRIRATFREARSAADMSAQDVADETARLGYPVSRSAIARYEGGTKLGLDVAELLVLAAALRVPPISLLFGGHPDEAVEVLPGDERDTVSTIAWFSGDAALAKDAVVEPDSPSSKMLHLMRSRAAMHRTLAETRRAVGDASAWAQRHREANMEAADSLLVSIAEVEDQITELTEGESK